MKSRIIYPAAGFVLNMILGIMYAWSIFVLPLEKDFGWNRSETSLTFTLIMICFSLGTILSGILLPRLKPTLTAALGGILAGGGFFFSSFISSLGGLYFCYGIMGGLGIGIAYVVPLAVSMRWFPDKKGLVSGLLTMGLALGTFFLGSLAANSLVEQFGWVVTLRILGVAVAVISVLAAMVFRLPPADYCPAGYHPPPQNEGVWGFSLKGALKTRAWIMTFLWICLIQSGGLMLLGHIVPFVKELSLTQGQAAVALGIAALANGLGRLFFGWFFDRAGRRLSMSITGIFMTLGLLGLTHLPQGLLYPALLVATIMVGMSFGGSISQLATLCAGFFGLKNFAIIFAFSTTGIIVASVAGPALGGSLRSHFGSYDLPLYLAAGMAAVTIVLVNLIRQPKLTE